MGKIIPAFSLLLVMLGVVSAQTDGVQRGIPNWLTGILAVAVFLFLVFVAFIVNKAWCTERRPDNEMAETSTDYGMTNGCTYDTVINVARTDEDENVYMNTTEGAEEKVTAM
ncbi:PDZK1-interacting protein 1 [Engraulis encrasicolus]|uniref:PDZK1-interacting protein 1 n=1 Tax=Engraulis encrasicolus TaxID=184585 RepID=UPI002FD1EE30